MVDSHGECSGLPEPQEALAKMEQRKGSNCRGLLPPSTYLLPSHYE